MIASEGVSLATAPDFYHFCPYPYAKILLLDTIFWGVVSTSPILQCPHWGLETILEWIGVPKTILRHTNPASCLKQRVPRREFWEAHASPSWNLTEMHMNLLKERRCSTVEKPIQFWLFKCLPVLFYHEIYSWHSVLLMYSRAGLLEDTGNTLAYAFFVSSLYPSVYI